MALDPDLKRFAQAKNFAALTTLMPDGHPQTQIMWVHADDDHLLINTETGRQKFRNVEADPRVTVTIFSAESAYEYVEARGRVVETITGDAARANIDELAQKYTNAPYAAPIGTERVVLKIAPERLHRRLS